MKNITKILFVAITSLSLMLSAKAGELTVNGTAKATYNATSGQQKDNGIGIYVIAEVYTQHVLRVNLLRNHQNIVHW